MTQRLLKTALLVLLGLFLYTRVTNGTIYYYINDRFITLTWVAAIGFILVASSYLRFSGEHAHEDSHDHAGHDPDHSQHDHGQLTWLGLLIVAIPLVLGWLVPPRPLGAAAIGNREVNLGQLSSIAPPNAASSVGVVTGQRSILDWLGAFQTQSDPTTFNGQEASIIGFVYRDDRFAGDTFMVSRFTVSCCVADAAPIGLIVRWPDSPNLPTDQWVEVKGHFEVGEFNGIQMPILIGETITPTDPPAQPYLYL